MSLQQHNKTQQKLKENKKKSNPLRSLNLAKRQLNDWHLKLRAK